MITKSVSDSSMTTALCNIFLNSEEKLNVFKETFPCVFLVSDNWLIYIRGKFREQATDFVKTIAGNNIDHCIFFNGLDNTNWGKNTLKMLEQAKYPTLFIYIEDHLLINSLEYFKNSIADMENNSIDFFLYSFFGQSLNTNNTEIIRPYYTDYFVTFDLNKNNLKSFKSYFPQAYTFSLPSVVSLRYFKNILQYEKFTQLQIPFFFQGLLSRCFGFRSPRNRFVYSKINKFLKLLNIRLVIYRTNSPFNTERSVLEIEPQLLPIKIGLIKKELFSCIEDDNAIPESSLIKRGLYPYSLKARTPNDSSSHPDQWSQFSISPEKSLNFQFYPNTQRVSSIPLKNIVVTHGELTITSQKECYTLKQDEQIWVHANIPHTLSTKTGSTFKSLLIIK